MSTEREFDEAFGFGTSSSRTVVPETQPESQVVEGTAADESLAVIIIAVRRLATHDVRPSCLRASADRISADRARALPVRPFWRRPLQPLFRRAILFLILPRLPIRTIRILF